ncbi:peptidoglycan DD-metalloendopeptidase family protein [Pseudidiomarina sp. GXY010]|uniref:Peptidoglycan DD-metalloendopeptidase family protein n=2 Tax=Pseudidiomarina fusca TaxID=2965078 RepID=A0ABU3KTN1_9GAMM|nr:peptidoglycan DD-metalloendopeptidase family protein [Pseudidiomarina sp. GXY010]
MPSLRMCGHVKQIIGLSALVVLFGCAEPPPPAPVKKLYHGRTVHDFEAASLAAASYQVERGDTLYSIAFRANVDVRELAQLNNISEPYLIFPGQRLRLKAVEKSSKSVAKTSQTGYRDTKLEQKQSKPVTPKTAATPVASKPPATVISSPSNEPFAKEVQWRWPATGKVIRDFSTAEAGNKGLDIGGDRGAPIYAAAAGKVVYAGNALKGYGQLIIVKHNDDYISAYAHNQTLLVQEQQWVKQGEVIAEMGDTDAAQVMLHFEIRFRGKSVNPRHYLPRG